MCVFRCRFVSVSVSKKGGQEIKITQRGAKFEVRVTSSGLCCAAGPESILLTTAATSPPRARPCLQLEREHHRKAGALAPWFDLEGELTRKSNGQLFGLLAGQRDAPVGFGVF